MQELEGFRNITKENTVVISYSNPNRFSGCVFTLMDMDITHYTFVEAIEAEPSNAPSRGPDPA